MFAAQPFSLLQNKGVISHEHHLILRKHVYCYSKRMANAEKPDKESENHWEEGIPFKNLLILHRMKVFWAGK